ncbi:MAG: hypothetical protein NW207_05205 [Cytophagales bacterium]|nr:hypothetical protein [Cytophagales bacterium]
MKNIKHHTIIVTCQEKAETENIRNQIVALYKQKMEVKTGHKLITPIFESLINSFFTFYIIPDGSKEGYDASEDGDILRQEVYSLLLTYKSQHPHIYIAYAELSYGGDNEAPKIINAL